MRGRGGGKSATSRFDANVRENGVGSGGGVSEISCFGTGKGEESLLLLFLKCLLASVRKRREREGGFELDPGGGCLDFWKGLRESELGSRKWPCMSTYRTHPFYSKEEKRTLRVGNWTLHFLPPFFLLLET